MTKARAVDRLLHDLGWPESWRDYAERILNEKTDHAETMDADTYDAILNYIRSL